MRGCKLLRTLIRGQWSSSMGRCIARFPNTARLNIIIFWYGSLGKISLQSKKNPVSSCFLCAILYENHLLKQVTNSHLSTHVFSSKNLRDSDRTLARRLPPNACRGAPLMHEDYSTCESYDSLPQIDIYMHLKYTLIYITEAPLYSSSI